MTSPPAPRPDPMRQAQSAPMMQEPVQGLPSHEEQGSDEWRNRWLERGSWSVLARMRDHPEGGHVELQDRLLLGALVGVLLADVDQPTHDLRVEAVTLGLGIYLSDICLDGGSLLIHPLYAFDEGSELILSDSFAAAVFIAECHLLVLGNFVS